MDAGSNHNAKYQYKDHMDEQKKKLLDDKDKTNTQRATVQPIKQFNVYICHGLSLLEMHSGGNDQRPQCCPTSLGILGAR